MEFDLDQRTASLSVGEFSSFTLGPQSSGGSGHQGIWRAQLGTQWHQELRQQVSTEQSDAEFEVSITGQIFHQGWTLSFAGRIDQILPGRDLVTLREIKTVTRELPTSEEELRSEYPEYFAQIATYLALRRIAEPKQSYRAELLFVEAGSGLAQPVPLQPIDESQYRGQLDRVAEFLNLRLQSRERLRNLRYQPAFDSPRPGQETTQADLTSAFEKHPAVLFEAPTGFGKTGVLLEFALGQLQSGHFDRALYLTSKSTGQIQVVRQLAAMTTPDQGVPANPSTDTADAPAVAAWHVRNKSEHCINHTFHCVRDSCSYLRDMEERWPGSGLSRFYRLESHARDLETLRNAGREARICPYEITRASLAFNDVWIGDYNYVFAPNNRTLFYQQSGFNPARTLLIIDEAHNLPSRAADAHSHIVHANDVRALLAELDHLNAPTPLVRAWESYTQLLSALLPMDSIPHALEDDLHDTLEIIINQLATQPLDYAALGPQFSDQLWQTQVLSDWLKDNHLRKLLWCRREGELSFTCLDAGPAIGKTLHAYGGIVLASATLSPVDTYAETCGLDLAHTPVHIHASTPWRDGAYDVAVDARVETTYQQRTRYFAITAATVTAMQEAAQGPIAVFFPSYAYAESVLKTLNSGDSVLRVALQPRLRDLHTQSTWVEESLALSDALFLVLGSSFAESIDLLGGHISHAMVVGPALPEVNAVQRARMAEFEPQGRDIAFRRVYQVPGLQKVNQALGRLVRAPGQRAKVLLHCRRFTEARYASLLATDYQFGVNITSDDELNDWLVTESTQQK